MKKTSIYAIIIIILLIFLGIYYISNKSPKTNNIKIGAILPLTGNAAIYGNPIKNSMELAKEELKIKGINIEIYYEDSAGDPKQAVSAYENLKLKNIDVVVSALSRSSVPLVPLSKNDKIPLIMTVMSAKIEKTPYLIRFYSDNSGYSNAHFNSIDKNIKNLSLVYVTDEFGQSLRESIIENANKNKINIIYEEKFEPGTKDFRTILLKLKEKNPDAMMFIGATPAEIIEPLKESKELGINIPFYEVGTALSIKSARNQTNSEGAFTTAFPFVLNKSGNTFREKYKEKYSEEPFFSAPFGYDTVYLIYQATNGKKTTGKELLDNIYKLKTFNSSNEEVEIKDGEINPKLYSVKIVNNELIEVKN